MFRMSVACARCKGKNVLIACECGLCGGQIRVKYDRKGRVRKYINGHAGRENRYLLNHRLQKGSNNSQWKGGIKKINGYIKIKVFDHPHKDNHGYVGEHTLIVEQQIGRYLKPNECVHHINGKRDDNRIENLTLMDKREHARMHSSEMIKHTIRDYHGYFRGYRAH